MKEIIIKEHTLIEDLLVNRGLVIIDLGACQGEFINAISTNYTIKKAVLVEPNPINFAKLANYQEGITCLNMAAKSGKKEKIQFIEDLDSPYNGSLIFDYFHNKKIHIVETVNLHEIYETLKENEIDVLKVDIEGAEYDLLTNATDEELLVCKQITVEFHDFLDIKYRSLNLEIHKRMISLGFGVIKKRTSHRLGSEYYDTLFFKN